MSDERRGENARQAILALAARRIHKGGVNLAEVLRSFPPEEQADYVAPIYEAMGQLHAEGLIEITKRNRCVDPKRIKGPYRVRLRTDSIFQSRLSHAEAPEYAGDDDA